MNISLDLKDGWTWLKILNQLNEDLLDLPMPYPLWAQVLKIVSLFLSQSLDLKKYILMTEEGRNFNYTL